GTLKGIRSLCGTYEWFPFVVLLRYVEHRVPRFIACWLVFWHLSPIASKQWRGLNHFATGRECTPPVSQVSIYQIGDEGYVAKYKDGGRFEIEFREVQCATKSHGGRRDRIRSIRYGSLTDDSSKADVRL